MKLRQSEDVLIRGGTQAASQQDFGIVANAKMYDMFSSSIYSNKPHAIVRELIANGDDSNRSVGSTRPMKLTMPTKFEPNIVFRDYGTGISEEDMYRIYTVYGKSTKDNSNDDIGGMGIGSKSPYSYTDTFTVKSYQGGTCKVYTCYKNDGIPQIEHNLTMDTDEDNGLEVSFYVREDDFGKFKTAAEKILSWFGDRVECSSVEPDVYEESNGIFYQVDTDLNSPSPAIKMGPIVYPLQGELKELFEGTLFSVFSSKVGGALTCSRYFYYIMEVSIGDLDLPPSREYIDNSSHNEVIIKKLLNEMETKFAKDILDVYESVKDEHWLKAYESLSDAVKVSYKDAYHRIIDVITSHKSFKVKNPLYGTYKGWNSERSEKVELPEYSTIDEIENLIENKSKQHSIMFGFRNHSGPHFGTTIRKSYMFPHKANQLIKGVTFVKYKSAWRQLVKDPDVFNKVVNSPHKELFAVKQEKEEAIKFIELVLGEYGTIALAKDLIKKYSPVVEKSYVISYMTFRQVGWFGNRSNGKEDDKESITCSEFEEDEHYHANYYALNSERKLVHDINAAPGTSYIVIPKALEKIAIKKGYKHIGQLAAEAVEQKTPMISNLGCGLSKFPLLQLINNLGIEKIDSGEYMKTEYLTKYSSQVKKWARQYAKIKLSNKNIKRVRSVIEEKRIKLAQKEDEYIDKYPLLSLLSDVEFSGLSQASKNSIIEYIEMRDSKCQQR